MRTTFSAALVLIAAATVIGCTPLYESLPANQVLPAPPGISDGSSPVHAWRAETPVLKTFWGDQALKVQCQAHFPDSWRRTGDERWEVRCVNQVGTTVPYLGVLYRGRNSLGQETTEVLPAFDIQKLGDGLYLLADSGVKTAAPDAPDAAPKIVEIRPTLELVEIRRHQVWPFRIRIPLLPDKPSELTPAPKEVPADPAPRGTEIPRG